MPTATAAALNLGHVPLVARVYLRRSADPWVHRYPQKNAMFGRLDARARVKAAREWIANTTGVALTETEYKLYLGLFRSQVERRLA